MKEIFVKCYPDLIDSNGNIKYPIDDRLIRKMPQLHDIEDFPKRPKLHKIFMTDSSAFEDLLQIWEFASNWFNMQKGFKLEELYSGLKYTGDEEVSLISDIIWTILDMVIKELPEEESEDGDSLLWMIKQLSEEKLKFVWPFTVSIITTDKNLAVIAKKLQRATPKTFNKILTYEEKITILLFLCNYCHELPCFREYIMERLKEKNKYSKEKQETYNEIREQNEEKKKRMEQHSKSDFVLNDDIKNEITILEDELKNATRTQAKAIRDKLLSLTRDKDNYKKTIQSIEEKIQTLEAKIKRLNDQIWKVSLKISVIGRDLNNEYWYF